ncbi:MAG: circularly permuted type 2 ATP-grasp protein [Acidimicrobiia bacterium]
MSEPLPFRYRPMVDRFDEAVTPAGELADAWRTVASGFAGIGDDRLLRLREDAARLLDAQASTHLVHDDTAAASRPWELDPVPIAIGADEWHSISQGIAQRVLLLEAVLGDLYGDRRLLAEGVVPVEAVAGQAAYRLPLIGARPPAGPRIVVYGIDLVRTADGVWRVLRDATDAPAGLGYAMLNRAVLSRLLPEPFRAGGVARLLPFEAVLRAALAAATPSQRERSRVVVLTGGVDHDSYVEHALLASTLGYHLAEPQDLVVREGRVWLHSIEGLEPVDVVYRRLDDASADPLELGVVGGVPGLTLAARSGRVGMANHLGSALAGSLGLQPFLDACSRHLLGEELRLAPIPAIWCGDAQARAEVEADIGRFVLHDTTPRREVAAGARAVFGDRLDGVEETRWRALLRDAPERVVAQEHVRFASSPVLGANGPEPGEVTVRLIAVHGPDGVEVLPGGVARVVDESIPVVAQPRGAARGVVKDVWVVGVPGRPSGRVAARMALDSVDLRDSLPTRAAEALTWVGRYLERADATTRLAKVVAARAGEDPSLPTAGDGAWLRVVAAGLRSGVGRPAPADTVPDPPLGEILGQALQGERGLAGSLLSLGRSAGAVRQYLSRSTSGVLRDLAALAEVIRADAASLPSPGSVEAQLDRVIVDLAALAGLIAESMVRGPAWRFLDMGRRVERVLITAGSFEAMLSAPVLPALQGIVLDSVLAAHESLVAYRRRYRTDPELDNVLDLLAADDTNPRSLQFQLDRLRELVLALPARPSRQRLADLVETAASGVAASPWLDDAVVKGRRMGVERLVLDVRGPMLAFAAELADGWFAELPLHRMGRHG